MKVMFVVERMEVGGAQRQIAYMANHLSRRNIEVSLLVVKKKGEMLDKIVPEVEIVSCFRLASRMPFWGVIFQVLAIIRAARSKKPNVIYCRLMEFPGAVAGKILGIPTVVAEINNPRKSLEIKYNSQ
ncbi:MAG: glycosyltransferase family 4 protein [Candidatus Dadabacteria bacterium]|nr:glycosyltransferase family 4 protein [Candidatus Dadabacteria bacterium]MXZ48318.1 glycosyltransferase family 4 protein [Candidatus Dadabacteria bacterium]MYB27052.1 glycosyltransferase family 4 protein [Candidatus Dadabacteria bacterium]